MKMLNKNDMLAGIVSKTGLTKKHATMALDATIDTISNALAKGNGVRLMGFGSFKVRHRATRKGRNPQTGKSITIAAHNFPAFKAGKYLKDEVNK